jgi:tetratricopeptide (TPR) repeat protein
MSLHDEQSARPSRVRVVQGFTLVWLDPTIDESNADFKHSLTQLLQIINTINTFTDADSCIDYLTEIKDERVFMIVSDVLHQQLVPLIHEISQLYSIYVLCSNMITHEDWKNEWTKMKGVFTQIESICKLLEQDTKQCEHDLFSISIVPPGDYSQQNLNELPPLFMYSKILKEILLDIEHDEHAKTEFVQLLREEYRNNASQLRIIHEFERDYHPHLAISWYTRECFIYSLLNRVLRTMNTDIVIKMGFFLRDLHRQIEQLHIQQQSDIPVPLIVYRGQGMIISEFEKLCNSIGGLLSFNNFLSTSTNPEVSKMFCPIPPQDPNIIPILFEMKVDSTLKSIPFASLDNISSFDDEHEILFSMHTVFRIDEIESDENGLWKVKLTLTKDDDQQLRQLTDRIREETQGSTGWHQLGQLLIKMANFDKAEEIYQILLQDQSKYNGERLAHLYNQIGGINQQKGDYKEALKFYQKTLQLCQKSLSPNHPNLATTYNNIGQVYHNMGDYSRALEFYQKTLEIQQKSLSPNHLSLATTYGNIGQVHYSMGKYSRALKFHQSAVEIFEKSLPLNHPYLATTYNNIGQVHYSMGEYPKALQLHQKTLEIQKKSLPPNHPDLANTYNNIGAVYCEMQEYSNALVIFQKTLEICQKSLPPNHPDLATSYSNIGLIHNNMGEYPKALEFYQKTLEIQQKYLHPNHPSLAISHNNIGGVYNEMEEYSKALSYYEKSLEIYQKSLPSNHPLLAATYNNIGLGHNNMGEYPKALEFYQSALEIFQKSLPSNHPNLATAYNNIGRVYDKMGDCSKALQFYQKTLEIQQNSLPRNHSRLATTYSNIGQIHKKIGEYSKALKFYEKTLEIFEESLPPNHPDLVISYNNIGELYNMMQEYPRALKFYQKALEISQDFLPSNHPLLQLWREKLVAIGKNC